MKKILNYKKWLLIGTIVLFFAPIGITPNHTTQSSSINSISLSANVALAQATPQQANNAPKPQTPSFLACTQNVAVCGIYYTAYTVNIIVALFVNLGAWLVGLGLQFNNNIFLSPAIQVGFSVSLAIANLGFVLGIIIIALATIIRNETYGVKQLLWKLVVMALLVNFGLVIMAPIVGFADSMSTYFINATSPQVATGGYTAYVNTMTQAFAPQTVNQNSPSSDPTAVNIGANAGCAAVTSDIFGLCKYIAKLLVTLSPSDNLVQMTMAMVFGIVFTSLTAFTFLCLAVLLIIRYLMLGGLLIILPLAWLMWIFPKFNSNFSKWWDTFIKWTFFPPLALFFIYLAFLTAANTGNNSTNAYLTGVTRYAGDVNGPAAGIATQTGLATPIQQAADEILLVGLTVMGLMFANSLSGKAGATVVHAGTTASKAVGGYLGKQGKKAARTTLRAAGGERAMKAMREGRLGGLQRVPVAGWLATRGASLAAGAIAPHLTNKELVENEKKKVPESVDQIKQALKGNMNTEKRIAHISKLIEKGELSKDVEVGKDKIGDYLDKNPGIVQDYSFQKGEKDANKMMGSDTNMRAAQKNIEALGTAADPAKLKEANDTLVKATNAFVNKLEKSDIAKMNVNEVFKKDNPFAAALANSFATQAPHLASSAMPKMKSGVLKGFKDIYENQITELIDNSPRLKEIKDSDKKIAELREQKTQDPRIKTLKDEIERMKTVTGDENYKAEQIKQRNAKIAEITKKIDEDINNQIGKKQTSEKNLSEEEKNILFASTTFKSSLNANATFGAVEPGAAPAAPAAPAPH